MLDNTGGSHGRDLSLVCMYFATVLAPIMMAGDRTIAIHRRTS